MLKNDTVIQDKIFTKPYNLMLVVSLLVYTGHYMLMATMPLYAKNLSGSNVLAGMMVSALTFSALAFHPVFGLLIDDKGRKIVLVIGAILFVAVALFYNMAHTVVFLVSLRIMNGIGFSAHTSAAGTIVSDLTPKSRLAEGIGYYGISVIIGTAIGPALGLFLVDHSGYGVLFLSVFVLWTLGLVIALLIDYEKKIK